MHGDAARIDWVQPGGYGWDAGIRPGDDLLRISGAPITSDSLDPELVDNARTLDVHIRRLRQKLEKCGDCIETVVGVGYRFVGCSSQALTATDKHG